VTATFAAYMPMSTNDISNERSRVPSGVPMLNIAGTMKQNAQMISIDPFTASRRGSNRCSP
jgi:hypothetical protein